MTQPWKEASITLGSRRQGGRDSVTEREASGIKYSVCSCPGLGALYYKRTLSSIILQENPKPREGETPRFRRNRKGTSNYTRVFRIQNT